MHQCVCEAWLRLCPPAAHLYYQRNQLLCALTSAAQAGAAMPHNCISTLFESGFLGSSTSRQKMHWTVPSRPHVEGKCSEQKAKAGCSQHGCPWKRAVTRQQIPVDAADRQTASSPHPAVGMCYHRDPQETSFDAEQVMWSCPTNATLSC